MLKFVVILDVLFNLFLLKIYLGLVVSSRHFVTIKQEDDRTFP